MGGPLALLAALWALGAAGDAALRIGAFNIRSFGDSKVSYPACSGIIAQILAGYDITLVQEVRDSDLSAVSALMELINSVSRHEYSFVSSKPLGQDQYKETYLFVYRKDTVSVVDTYQYLDSEDAFSREPFVVKFSAAGSAAEELVLIPLHAAPHQAVAEIDALYDVYLDLIDKTCCFWATLTPTAATCRLRTGWPSACAAARSSSGSSRTAPTPRWATQTVLTTASWSVVPACAVV
ncbi:deoxyribonuclease-1-like 2 isoform X3 [Phocoena sinus]|uniref:deoxyribonuclease-1-like 2 isoform X3 n=1 Tax=Phocoena sinus TaxID=42100 RepID=UPI0013C4AF0D|nr:deoxyribonuclease-1-like 2 isoform X3 [Phocoena sinus]